MQPIKYLINWLQENANYEHYLFSLKDLRSLYPDLSEGALKTLLSRAVTAGYLIRVCRGVYSYKKAMPSDGLLLFRTAAILRVNEFIYLSLESLLSEAGVISQVPTNWITLMCSGRSNIISCGEFGTIEFIHTNRKPTDLMKDLSYDINYGLWKASVPLALTDMKLTRRNYDLIDWDVVNELI